LRVRSIGDRSLTRPVPTGCPVALSSWRSSSAAAGSKAGRTSPISALWAGIPSRVPRRLPCKAPPMPRAGNFAVLYWLPLTCLRRHREARNAPWRSRALSATLDCFALLAMTGSNRPDSVLVPGGDRRAHLRRRQGRAAHPCQPRLLLYGYLGLLMWTLSGSGRTSSLTASGSAF